MTIQWLGNSCFKIQTKSNGGETTILTDQYAAKCGLPKMKFAADIVVLTTEQPGASDFDISQSYPILRRAWLNRLQQPSLIPGWKSLGLFFCLNDLDQIVKKYNIGIKYDHE